MVQMKKDFSKRKKFYLFFRWIPIVFLDNRAKKVYNSKVNWWTQTVASRNGTAVAFRKDFIWIGMNVE